MRVKIEYLLLGQRVESVEGARAELQRRLVNGCIHLRDFDIYEVKEKQCKEVVGYLNIPLLDYKMGTHDNPAGFEEYIRGRVANELAKAIANEIRVETKDICTPSGMPMVRAEAKIKICME